MKLTGVQCIEAINEINQSLDVHSDGLPINVTEPVQELEDDDTFEFNFLTLMEEEITPEDEMEYKYICETSNGTSLLKL